MVPRSDDFKLAILNLAWIVWLGLGVLRFEHACFHPLESELLAAPKIRVTLLWVSTLTIYRGRHITRDRTE